MDPGAGIEPAPTRSRAECSTTELPRINTVKVLHHFGVSDNQPIDVRLLRLKLSFDAYVLNRNASAVYG